MNTDTLDDEMRGIFDRADELLQDLAQEYQACAQVSKVSERVKNLFHEVLVKVRSALDFAMNRIYSKHSTLRGKAKIKRGRNVGFPIYEDKDKFDNKLESLGLSHLETDNPGLYGKLLKSQPFETGTQKLMNFRDLSNLGKHVKFARQDCKVQNAKKITATNGAFAIFSVGSGCFDKQGKPVGPAADSKVEEVELATFTLSHKSGRVWEPCFFCQEFCLSTRRYIESLLPLI